MLVDFEVVRALERLLLSMKKSPYPVFRGHPDNAGEDDLEISLKDRAPLVVVPDGIEAQ